MTKFKKVLLASTAAVMTAALAIGGTMAYLTSQDSDVNVMTLGNVEIEQIEYERAVDADGNFITVDTSSVNPNYGYNQAYKLQKFTQAKPAYPAVYTNGNLVWDEFQQLWNQAGAPGSNELFDDSVKNVIDKFVFVKNTGKSDAYYRTIIAIEAPEGLSDDAIHTSFNANSRFDYNSDKDEAQNAADSNKFYMTVDETRYLVYTATYTQKLAPGEVSRPSLLQLFLDPAVTNEDCALFGDAWDVKVISQAVQTNGFENSQIALDTAFGKVSEKAVEWFGGLASPVVVSDADGLVEALANDEDVVLADDVKINPANMSNAYGTTGINVKNGQTIDGAGHTLDIKGAGGTWDSGINTTGGTIKNLKVTGSFRGIFINHNSNHSEPVVLENVVIDGTTYTISCDQGMNQNFVAKNSTFNGWTSYAATLGNATFIDCDFGEGRGYAYCRPYAPTTFVGCDFEAGYELDARAAVTFENCTIGGVKLTADNLSTLVTGNIANATVK